MTKKEKLERFDAMDAELEKLKLALFDLSCKTRFPFKDHVYVNCKKEVDGDYDLRVRISVSERAMPVFEVREENRIDFWTENEIADKQSDNSVYWQVVRHGIWKLRHAQRKAVA